MAVLVVTSVDPLLHVVAPVSLAAAAGTALVVDRDPDSGWPFPVGRLADLVAAGPTARDLQPARAGVALLGGDVADSAGTDELLGALLKSWPAVVVRVPVLADGALRIAPALAWQPAADVAVAIGVGARAEAAIPKPPVRLLRSIVGGRIDPRWRWFRHWRPVWERAS